jgi:hypothetical protein
MGPGVRTLVLAVAAALVIAVARPRVAEPHRTVRETSEVYLLPPPEQLVRLSMGYRSALADVLWAHVLVAQGQRLRERRQHQTVSNVFEAIIELDPKFRRPYLLADALITFQAVDVPFEEVIKARKIMERGIAEHPTDAQIHLVLGQFVAFIAPAAYIRDDPELREEWRSDGAAYLAKAASLGGDAAQVGWGALGGAGILMRKGDNAAWTDFLLKTIAVTDDEELREKAMQMLGSRLAEAHRVRLEEFILLHKTHYPTFSKTGALVLGPPRSWAACSGASREGDPACAHTWKQWAEALGSAP